MIPLEHCYRLLDENFSLLTVGDTKIPNFTWKENQKEQLSKEQFKKQYEYKGGSEKPATQNVGIITGYDYLECIDVDLKVFSTAKEQIEFWEEYISFLKDNILDFDEKFVVYKTKNAGFHILYKSKRVTGNKKIAVLKGHKEAVIESRGLGGYIFIYEGKNILDKTYKDVEFITDRDRDILWSISKTYNYEKPEVKEVIPPKNKHYDQSKKTPWEDFNNKNSIFDIIGSDFSIVRTLKDKYVIKRQGAESPHSGYVYKDSGCMYLFSTGTQYDHEKLISPFIAFAQKNHNKDYSAAAKELYAQGYGERLKPEPIISKEKISIKKDDLVFPIDVFPEVLQKYILVCAETLNSSIDYMGCALLFLASVSIGNSLNVEVKKGWKETANLWMALVGKAGIGKTPSISNITYPLEKLNSGEIKRFIKDFQKYDDYKSLDMQEQQLAEEVRKPKKTQFIVNDITLEALIELHGENKNGIGVLKDELAGWFKDMNKYRQGSDLEHWLSSWSGKQINLNRKTARSSFVERALIPVLGGIQPAIMDSFYTDENKESGFLDRMLFSFPDLKVEQYNDKEMKQEYLQWYEDYMINFYENLKDLIVYNDDGEIEPHTARFSEDAKKQWIRIFNDITKVQNSDLENEYMKSMLPKQKSYIPRFSLILNTLASNEDPNIVLDQIEEKSMLKAEKLSRYFIAMAKKIKADSQEANDIKKVVFKNSEKSEYDKFLAVYEKDNKISKTKLANILNVSRQTIYNYIKEYENNNA